MPFTNKADAVQAAYEMVRDFMDEKTDKLSPQEYAEFLDKLGSDIELRADAVKSETKEDE